MNVRIFRQRTAPGTIERRAGWRRRGLRGHLPAFEVPVRTLARRSCPRRAAAEDLAQDVFVEVLTRLAAVRRTRLVCRLGAGIAVNRCLMHLRSPWQRSLRWLDRAPTSTSTQCSTGRTTQCGTAASGIDLERALARCADTARVVVWLHDVEGYTHAEIGALFGGSTSFSKSQLARAHQRLRGLLNADGVETPCMPVSTSC